MKNIAESPPSAVNKSPEETPLFDPEELKDDLVKEGIKDRSNGYFEAVAADKAPSPKDWNRYLQFQVARKRAEGDSSKFDLDPQDRAAIKEYSKKLADESKWADAKENIDYLSVAQGAMALRYLGAEVKFSEGVAKKLKDAFTKPSEKNDYQFVDFDKALRYGVALKNLRTFDADGKATSLFGDDERLVLARRNEHETFGPDKDEPIEKKVLRLARLDKFGLAAGSDERGRDMSAADFYKQQVASKLAAAVDQQMKPTSVAVADAEGIGKTRQLLKALAVSTSAFGESTSLGSDQSEAVRALIQADKDKGNWKEYLDDAVLAKQLDKLPTVAPDQEPAPAPEPPPAAAAQTVEVKFDETTERPIANEPALSTQPEQSTQPEAATNTKLPLAQEKSDLTVQPSPPEVSQSGTPDWVRDSHEAEFQVAKRLGLVDQIANLAAEGKVAAEIRQIIDAEGKGEKLDVDNMIRSVRYKLRIPSMDEPDEFTKWQAEWKAKHPSPKPEVESASMPTADPDVPVSSSAVEVPKKPDAEVLKNESGTDLAAETMAESGEKTLEEDRNTAAARPASKRVEAIEEPAVQATEPSPEKGFLNTVQGAREWLREHPKTAKTIKGAAIVGASVIAGASLPVAAAIGAGYFTIQAGRKLLKVYGADGYLSVIKNVFKDERSITAEQFRGYGRYVKEGKGFWRKFGRVFTGMSNN